MEFINIYYFWNQDGPIGAIILVGNQIFILVPHHTSLHIFHKVLMHENHPMVVD